MTLLRLLREFISFDVSGKQYPIREYEEYTIARRAIGAPPEEVSTGNKVLRAFNGQKAIPVSGTDDQIRFFVGMNQLTVTTNDLQFIEERRKADDPPPL